MTFMSLLPVYEPSTYRFFPNEDKLAHVIMYLVMALLLGFVSKCKGRIAVPWLWLIIVPSAYGYLMEILQDLLPTGRLFDNFDIIANIVGSFAGTMLFYMFNRRRNSIS